MLTDTNVSETFKKWKRQLEVYLVASGAPAKPNEVQTAIILHCAGPQVIEAYEHFRFDKDEDKK